MTQPPEPFSEEGEEYFTIRLRTLQERYNIDMKDWHYFVDSVAAFVSTYLHEYDKENTDA